MAEDEWELRQQLEEARLREEAAREARKTSFRVVDSEREQTGDEELKFAAARLPNPHEIAPRRWLYGTHLLRGFFTVLVAPGGVGKTTYAMGVALCLASGRALFGEKVYERSNVGVMNLEDPLEEVERRLAALMLLHNVDREEIEGRYFLFSGDDRRLSIAAASADGSRIIFPDKLAITNQIRLNRIGLLTVDPYAESHELDENSNPQMVQAAAAWRDICRETGCSIILIHHVRKGLATDIDAARGAKALTDSARVGILLTTMSDEEAAQYDVDPDDRHSYIHMLDAKSNMARRDAAGQWMKIESVSLNNATAMYPAGDHVAAVRQWIPPSALGDLTIVQCNEALDQIESGVGEGMRYAPTRRGKSSRWGGAVLIERFGISEQRAAAIIATWLKHGVLEARDYHDAEQRKERQGLFLVAAKRPGGLFR